MLKIDKIDDLNIKIQQGSINVDVAAIFFASASVSGVIIISPKEAGTYRVFSESLENIEINGVSGSEFTSDSAVKELNSFIGNFRKGGSTSGNNGEFVWGAGTGNLDDQTDLLERLKNKNDFISSIVADDSTSSPTTTVKGAVKVPVPVTIAAATSIWTDIIPATLPLRSAVQTAINNMKWLKDNKEFIVPNPGDNVKVHNITSIPASTAPNTFTVTERGFYTIYITMIVASSTGVAFSINGKEVFGFTTNATQMTWNSNVMWCEVGDVFSYAGKSAGFSVYDGGIFKTPYKVITI